MPMKMAMGTRPVIPLQEREVISQLVWHGTGHPLVCEKLASRCEVLRCDPAQDLATLNEVVVILFRRSRNGFVSGL